MTLVSKTLAPNGALVDPATGRATVPFNSYLNTLTVLANTAAGGTITTAPSSGLAGGGDISANLSLSIAPNGVENTMIRQSAGYSVIGRAFGTTGDVADITATANNRVLARIGNVLAFWDTALVPATVADGDYGDITVSGVGTVWTIDANVVSNAKFRQSTALTVVGRSAATTGNVADIAGTASQFLGVNAAGTVLAFQTLAGDATLSGPTLTLATVNANTGTWGSATQAPAITLDAKGRATAASNVTITPAASSITGGQTLSRTNDTNVTLTLGGTPATALLAATSMTLGWTGTLAAGRGGTGVSSLGDITRTNDTNVTLTLGGTPTGAVIISTSFTLGWTGRLAYSRFIAATQKSLVGATAAGDFGEITLGTGVAITAGVLSATGTGGTVTTVSVVTANGVSGSVANPTTTPAITLTLGNITPGSVAATGMISTTVGGSGVTPQIYLNGIQNNWIEFAAVGTGDPTFTTLSFGAKIVLYPALGAAAVDYAIGISSQVLWQSVDTTASSFKWFGGTTLALTLSGTGNLTAVGTVAGTNITTGGNTTGNSATATKWATGRTIGITGDATWTSPSLDGSANVTAAITFATVNSNVGTFGSVTKAAIVTVNAKGLVTAASESTITPAASSITGGAALTKTDDTNVTLTLGGAPTTALLTASSLTLGWTGTLSVARGGTGDSGTAWASWTPTVTSETGTITSYTTACNYKTLGKTTWFDIDVALTNAGTAGGSINFTLPATSANTRGAFAGVEVGATGVALACRLTSTTNLRMRRYDNAFIGSTGNRFYISGTYEAA